ncbi:phage holin family protein [Paenibacillus sp. GCM10012307]|uniref:Phage holin family protein n=1 Tax=Paenibacillus roseus TaxID=2798579 RepID=A0A934MVG0_9BACL|nr:phage holin family protein [Paenibacillus roseus]MBJ6362082.1 phage holin family protein [Paenibacillus roseus]
MEWSFIFELIAPELVAVVAACWLIGTMLKQTPRIPDWSIVYIVTGFAVVLTGFVLGWSAESVIQGILCGAFAVLGHQFIKQAARAKEGEN